MNCPRLLLLVAVSCCVTLVASDNPAKAQSVKKRDRSARPTISTSAPVDDLIKCANLIYAGSKSSTCFSDKFLSTVNKETNVDTNRKFKQVKLAKAELFEFPFAVMTGEGVFSLHEQERINLKSYLTRGGFLLASAGCSSKEWNQSFRNEIKRVFPDQELKKITLDHKIFSTVFDITSVRLKKSSGSATLEGLEIDGKIVLVYSPEGLNDTANAGGGCCCCGGNEIRNSQEINVNVFTYALTH